MNSYLFLNKFEVKMIIINVKVRESMSVISTLESETAPLVKKRHLMKVIFGDYRKKMKTQSQITKK